MKTTEPVTIVVAVSRNGVIGLTDADGRQRLPWRIRSDLKHFKAITAGGVVIMGRRTFETLESEGAPNGLPNRLNIVVSRTMRPDRLPPGVILSPSVSHAIERSRELAPDRKIFIIGGGEIYREAMEMGAVQRIEITDVQAEIVAGTGERVTHFTSAERWSEDPACRIALGWRLIAQRETPAAPESGDEHACVFRTYERG